MLRTSDGLQLGAWFLPGAGPTARAVLVANGNGGNRSLRAGLAAAVAARGPSVLLFDYRGYGGNAGTPSEHGLACDARAAQSFLVDEEGFAPHDLVYFGESLGSAVVTRLATEHEPAGLVLRSPFADLASVGELHYPFLPVRALLHDRFEVAQHVARVTAPVTVVLGAADRIVPPEQSRRVAAAAASLRGIVTVPGADHNDIELVQGRAVIDAVLGMAEDLR